MQCGVCGDPTDQQAAERRDLGGDDAAFVCPDCQGLADDVASDRETDDGRGGSGSSATSGTIGSYSGTGSDSEATSDSDSSDGVTTKYAI